MSLCPLGALEEQFDVAAQMIDRFDGNDLVLDNATMTCGSLNIHIKPMLKIFRDSHLGRVNVCSLIAAIE
jgi:hypothetical protein